MSLRQIRLTLESRLKAWADSQAPALKVAGENFSFTKPVDGSMFLEIFFIPNVTLSRETSAAKKTYLGLFQINVWCRKDQGMGKLEDVADKLATMFPHALKLGRLTITDAPSVERPFPDDSGWVILPVLIKYRYDT